MMELVRFRLDGQSSDRIGLHQTGVVYEITPRFGTLADFLREFPDGWTDRSVQLQALATHRIADVALLPPLDPAGTLYLVGANYRQHAEEAGLSVPKIPVFFSKPATALVAHGRAIALPPISAEMDYEGSSQS